MATTTGILNNTANAALTNNQINVHNASTTHNYHHPTPSEHSLAPLAKLYRHCAPAAFLNSAERPDPPKCSPKTRGKLLGETKGFATAEGPTSSALWLTGSAGSGKTAISQTTAEELKKQGRVLGCHFFFRSSKDGKRSDGHCWVPNLVHEMVCVLPETRPYVEKIIRRRDSVFDQQPDGVLEELFLKPLKVTTGKRFIFRRTLKWILGKSSATSIFATQIPLLVVVDGLDECKSPEMQVHILRTIANAIPKLPIPIRFLIASRPETHIRAAINDLFGYIPLHRINLDEDQDIRKDLDEYYHDRFNALRRDHPSLRGQEAYQTWPSQEQIEALIAKSSTQFIFASTVMNYISHRGGNPFTRLDIVLGIKVTPQKDKPYLELDILYRIILLTVEEDERKIIFLILSFVYLAGKGDYPDLQLSASPEFLEKFLKLDVGDVPRFLNPLVSILSLPEAPSGIITMLHASFFDYLCDPDRSEDLTMKFDGAHEVVAWRVFDEGERLSWNLFESLSSANAKSDLLASKCVVLESFLLHASRATMSIDLGLALFALEQSIIQMICFRESELSSPNHQFWLVDRRSQINTLLVSKLGGQLAGHDSLFHVSPTWSTLQRHQQEMGNLIIEFIADEPKESTLANLICKLQSGLDNWSDFTKPRLSGKLGREACQSLVTALIQASPHTQLYRRDVLELLRKPDYIFSTFLTEADGKHAREILEFIREFRRQSLFEYKIRGARIDTGLIIHLDTIWARHIAGLEGTLRTS
ncbi:hypothetical protein CPB83DRAFT_515287 [Crepidotus variabilis]|uniref:Nephrocystin 3-like N-terminal domain-containing protein n=1 Tax=Crepidotus variabilis TaxID=179855 RepID=A0A9P6EB01_9AGAR|nr:hypothetical protein CPB83DRAFT_515287 [Crepidotus variabilis]